MQKNGVSIEGWSQEHFAWIYSGYGFVTYDGLDLSLDAWEMRY